MRERREALLSALAELKIDLTVVFDSELERYGASERAHWRDVEIVYVEEGKSADDYILEELSLSSHPQRETVITSDRALARQCRHYGAHILSVELFLQRLAKKRSKKPQSKPFQPKESPSEFARLLKIFEERLLDD